MEQGSFRGVPTSVVTRTSPGPAARIEIRFTALNTWSLFDPCGDYWIDFDEDALKFSEHDDLWPPRLDKKVGRLGNTITACMNVGTEKRKVLTWDVEVARNELNTGGHWKQVLTTTTAQRVAREADSAGVAFAVTYDGDFESEDFASIAGDLEALAGAIHGGNGMDVSLVSDLNAAFITAAPDNPDALNLGDSRQIGARIRFDGVPFRGVPYAISADLESYGLLALWDFSVSLGTGYWVGPVSLAVLGGVGLESGGRDPRRAPLLLTTDLQATAAVNLTDLFRLRLWIKPTWLVSRLQGEAGDLPFSDVTHTQPLLSLAGRPSDELSLGAALAVTIHGRGPANQPYNGSQTFWIGTEYRAALRNKMLGFCIGYGVATGSYNAPPTDPNSGPEANRTVCSSTDSSGRSAHQAAR